MLSRVKRSNPLDLRVECLLKRILLSNSVVRFTDDDVDEMYREAPIKGSMFDYLEFTRILKHGAKEKDEQ